MSEITAHSENEGSRVARNRERPPPTHGFGETAIGIHPSTIIRGSWIPSGSFCMGSPVSEHRSFGTVISDSGIYQTSGESYGEHQHQVILTHPFFVSEVPCTQEQWTAVMNHNPSHFVGEHRPVEGVSWFDAMDYCRILTETHRNEGILPDGWHWSLPTEAQWEYACRAGTTGPFAGDIRMMAWYSDTAFEATGKKEEDFEMEDLQTQPVRTKLPNAWGLYDMHGNVGEWCLDWYADYQLGTVIDPVGPAHGFARVIRGGSCQNPDLFSRSANREADEPTNTSETAGFRPVLVPERFQIGEE
jgi:sulfatase modifying factor 1